MCFSFSVQPPSEEEVTPLLPSPPTEPPNSIDSPEDEFLEAQAGSLSEDDNLEEDREQPPPIKASSGVSQEPVPVAQ